LPVLGVAAWLVVANDVRAWAAAGLLSVAVLVGYVFTRLVGTTFDNQDVGNWACVLGLASIFVEIWLLALSGSALALAKVKLSKPAIEIRSSRPRVTENQRRAANANRP
jgi:predicted Co/Zn/Cd cation transporter (cation efflux family)